MSGSIHLILGGARSGKSSYAEQQAITKSNAALPLIYIATATAGDAEMANRIKHHQESRSQRWQLVEETTLLAQRLNEIETPSVILIDCLTLWLSNCLHSNDGQWAKQSEYLIESVSNCKHHVYMVSNEVGYGITPMGELSRQFVDESGRLHQQIAHLATSVTMMFAGLPMMLKSQKSPEGQVVLHPDT